MDIGHGGGGLQLHVYSNNYIIVLNKKEGMFVL